MNVKNMHAEKTKTKVTNPKFQICYDACFKFYTKRIIYSII